MPQAGYMVDVGCITLQWLIGVVDYSGSHFAGEGQRIDQMAPMIANDRKLAEPTKPKM